MESHSHIVIKFNNTVIHSRTNEALTLKASATQDDFLNQFTYRSIVTDEMLLSQNQINTVNFNNLVGICYVQGLDKVPLEEKESIAQKMSAYDFVEYAYVEIQEKMELSDAGTANVSSQIETPEQFNNPYFISPQGYKDGVTPYYTGIDMEYAWSIGITGQGIQIADLEDGNIFDHINLKRDTFINYFNSDKHSDHSAAVAGIMYAKDAGFGIKGMVHGADAYYSVSDNLDGSGRAAGIARALEVLTAGDVCVYEMQTAGPSGNFVPADYNQAVWDATQEALEAGILVVAAAGNGSENLDDEMYDEYRNRPDNGIIRVGAGLRFDQRREGFSTYGSIIHLQGWGTRVTSAGGDDFIAYAQDEPEENCGYTFKFQGTSAASPIVASAVVAIQSWYKQKTGNVLTPFEMRDLLVETGTPQTQIGNGSLQHIGPLPNIRNAINALEQRLALK